MTRVDLTTAKSAMRDASSIVPGSREPSENVTLISKAFSTTW